MRLCRISGICLGQILDLRMGQNFSLRIEGLGGAACRRTEQVWAAGAHPRAPRALQEVPTVDVLRLRAAGHEVLLRALQRERPRGRGRAAGRVEMPLAERALG